MFNLNSALNFFDILQAQGKYQSTCGLPSSTPTTSHFSVLKSDQPPFPFVLGAEFAGVIAASSPIPNGCPFKPGDRVFGSAQVGRTV